MQIHFLPLLSLDSTYWISLQTPCGLLCCRHIITTPTVAVEFCVQPIKRYRSPSFVPRFRFKQWLLKRSFLICPLLFSPLSAFPVAIKKRSRVAGVIITQHVEHLPAGKTTPDFTRKPMATTVQEGKCHAPSGSPPWTQTVQTAVLF